MVRWTSDKKIYYGRCILSLSIYITINIGENNTMENNKLEAQKAWIGFWIMVLMAVSMISVWGEPDLVDAWIYYLSDGYYK